MVRVLLRLVVVLVVLALLLLAVDRVSSLLVARSVAQGLQVTHGVARPPAVAFRDSPFLTQAARGQYRRVEVTMEALPTAGPLVVDRLEARLFGVRAPTLTALRGDLSVLPVERGEAVATVSFAALERAAGAALRDQNARLTLGYVAADRLSFTAEVTTVVGSITVRGQARLGVEEGAVTVRLLQDTISGVPALLRSQVASQVDLSQLVPPLPFGFRASQVVVWSTGLELRASGRGLRIPV